MPALTDEVVPTLLLAATLLTGHKRRRFQAEVARQYCGGSARRAESAFGWGRDAVRTGLTRLRDDVAAARRLDRLSEDRARELLALADEVEAALPQPEPVAPSPVPSPAPVEREPRDDDERDEDGRGDGKGKGDEKDEGEDD